VKTSKLFILFLFAFSRLNAQAIGPNKSDNKDAMESLEKSTRAGVIFELKSDSLPSHSLEKIAEYDGGMQKLYQFIGNKVKYPLRCIDADIEGLVLVEFVVEKDGTLSNVSTRTHHKSCSEMDVEAIRVIKMTSGKWKPGYRGSEPVRSKYRLPVRFDLN
jgi:TonB family protein